MQLNYLEINKLSSEYLDDDDVLNKGMTIQKFKNWIKLYQTDLESLGIKDLDSFNYSKLKENNNINELWNIYTGLNISENICLIVP